MSPDPDHVQPRGPADDARGAAPPSADPVSAGVLKVSVRGLCAFGARRGDLDLRFHPVPSAQEGQAGHRLVQTRRGPDYEAEVALAARFGRLQVRGRADGLDATRRRVEEIKTFRGEFEAIKPHHRAVHWAQAQVYAWMLCEARGWDTVEVALVYLDLADGRETVQAQTIDRNALQQHFAALCQAYLAWAECQAAGAARRDTALQALQFPHASFRPGQRELARAVFAAARQGAPLLAQAPTGIGKTVATLFPLLRGWPAQGWQKIFFLTAKTAGRAVALDGLRAVAQDRGVPLKVVELVARDKVCEHPGRACHGDACPRAAGFYDRLPDARAAADRQGWLDRAALRSVAEAHRVCPYFLAQEMVRWCDVVVGDYNYYFDSSAFLFALAREEGWRVALLVDEAHNLLERAREMYSAQLDAPSLDAARQAAPAAIGRGLARVRREWLALAPPGPHGYAALAEPPRALMAALQETVALLAEHVAARPHEAGGPLHQCFFDLLHFVRLAEAFSAHSVFERHAAGPLAGERLALRNLVPAPFLRPRFAAGGTAVLFSGTLAPFDFYRELLGLPADTRTLDVDSPFDARQLDVRMALDISTRHADRARSLPAIVRLMARQFAAAPGNYLAFFSSFEHLEAAYAAFRGQAPDVPAWPQDRGMDEGARQAFIARFAPGGRGVGFAVLGGAFGEGVDLPGDRLIGAFVAGLGLPRHDAPAETMRERIEALFGQGYAYTYLYPGLRKVVQAAGRVIRGPADRGVLYLLDDRFARPAVAELLPRWWQPVRGPSAGLVGRRMRGLPGPADVHDGERHLQRDERIGLGIHAPDGPGNVAHQEHPEADLSPAR